MTPTPKLRFVEKLLYWDGRLHNAKVEKVLQQWWAPEGATENEIRLELVGEWRDVPLEKGK